MDNKRSMQSVIMVAFATLSIAITLILGVVMYFRFVSTSMQQTLQNTQKTLEQTTNSLEDYLSGMRQLSDTAYYSVVKENDINDPAVQNNLNLLYQSNKDSLISIALFFTDGTLAAAEPVANEKQNVVVSEQEWFVKAMGQVENMHFSQPHLQNLFDDTTKKYYWVVSLSRAVEINDGGRDRRGVLLVDMDYSGISAIIEKINEISDNQYFYLCNSNGDIIYHPKLMQMREGIFSENIDAVTKYGNGTYSEVFNGAKRSVVVDTVSYTGWKLVGVVNSGYTNNRDLRGIPLFIMILIVVVAMAMLLVSRILSDRIANPLRMLNQSVLEYEAGSKSEIYIGGTTEIAHLGRSIQNYYQEIERLIARFEKEQSERRRSELEALQSQINPHFLYNTLDSIIWMVESERNDEAVYMISQLARLFRISLSKGKTIINLGDEFLHAESYMNIQKIRYKDGFKVEFDLPDELKNYCVVKLVIQPILENAIYYGIEGMDSDDALIRVSAKEEGGDIFISVSDNGVGMKKEVASTLLTDTSREHKKGSGVGLVNVNNRIKIYFGEDYGLSVESEPDEGTTVTIHIPKVVYSQETGMKLEGVNDRK